MHINQRIYYALWSYTNSNNEVICCTLGQKDCIETPPGLVIFD